MGCAALRVVFKANQSVAKKDVDLYAASWQKTCAAGEAADCSNLGLLFVATGDQAQGRALLEKGCAQGDKFGCTITQRLGR